MARMMPATPYARPAGAQMGYTSAGLGLSTGGLANRYQAAPALPTPGVTRAPVTRPCPVPGSSAAAWVASTAAWNAASSAPTAVSKASGSTPVAAQRQARPSLNQVQGQSASSLKPALRPGATAIPRPATACTTASYLEQLRPQVPDKELENLLLLLRNPNLLSQRASKLFRQCDRDANGVLSMDELLELIPSLYKEIGLLIVEDSEELTSLVRSRMRKYDL